MTQTVPRPSQAPRTRSSQAALALLLTVQLMLILDMSVVNVALPSIQTTMGFTPSGLSWVLNAYTLAFGGLLLLGGRLGDVLGRRRTFLAGLAVFSLASLLGGLAQSPEMLVAARALQGAGGAFAAPSVLALITTSAHDEADRNRSLALFSAVSSAGASLGLLLGGVLTGYASWRWSLFINVPIGLAVILLVPRYVTETARRAGRFDLVGALAATLGSGLLVYGFVGAPTRGWSDPVTVGSLTAAATLLASFALTERRVREPLLDLALLHHRRRVGGIIAMTLMIGAQFGLFFFTVQFMQHNLGYGALRSGFAFLPLTVLIFAMSRIAPPLVSRVGHRLVIVAGLALLLGANLSLTQVTPTGGYLGDLLVPMLLTGAGAGLTFMPVTSVILADVAPQQAGTVSGMLQMSQQIGGSVGLAILVTVYASGSVPGAVVPGLSTVFATSAAMLSIGIIAAATLTGRREASATAK